MIISLIGFMAAGKTTMGMGLASSMRAEFIDLDSYIEEKEERTITEIFEKEGEKYFRNIECSSLEDILENHISEHPETIDKDSKICTLVLSLGGGCVTTPLCAELISKFTYCIYLKTDIETLFNRLSENNDTENRPLLKNKEGNNLYKTIEKLYGEREGLYEQLANKTIKI